MKFRLHISLGATVLVLKLMPISFSDRSNNMSTNNSNHMVQNVSVMHNSSASLIPITKSPILHQSTNSNSDSDISNSIIKAETSVCSHCNLLQPLEDIQWLLSSIVGGAVTAVKVVARCAYLSILITPSIIACPIAMWWSQLDPSSAAYKWWWNLLRSTVRQAGPCFTKLAQWIATRHDMFPLTVCEQLEVLQMNAYKHPHKDTEYLIHKYFGDSILVPEDSLIGCGSVAQVYRGSLVGSYDSPANPSQPSKSGAGVGVGSGVVVVAVKVLHPRVRHEIDMDMKILGAVGWIASHLSRIFSSGSVDVLCIDRSVSNFIDFMYSQLDLTLELKNLEQFRRNFKDYKDTSVSISFPRTFSSLSNADVLVESFEEGDLLSEVLKQEHVDNHKPLGKALLKAFLKMLFEDNFVHSDLHPGNILVHRSSPPSSDVRLTLLDAGLVTRLTAVDLRKFVSLFKAIICNDGEEAGRLMIAECSGDTAYQISASDAAGFKNGIKVVVAKVHKTGLQLSSTTVSALFEEVFQLSYQYNVKIDPQYVSVIISICILEGLGRRLDADLDLMKLAAPFVMTAAKKILIDKLRR